MVVVDSSALIPLAWVGHLNLIAASFDDIQTTEDVRAEVVVEGKRGTAALDSFLENVTIHETPAEAAGMATLEGTALADASVILIASKKEETMLANDKALIEVAKSHGVDCWWVTTVLLKSVKEDLVTATDATDVLYDLVNEGMNLHPKVYSQVQKKIRELGDDTHS